MVAHEYVEEKLYSMLFDNVASRQDDLKSMVS